MIQIYHPYWLWEDYNNGMYDSDLKENEIELIDKSIELLRSDLFFSIGLKMILKWKYSCENNLTNSMINRRAWIGRATCSFNHQCPELLTRIAWNELSEIEKNKANNYADRIIRIYERENFELYK